MMLRPEKRTMQFKVFGRVMDVSLIGAERRAPSDRMTEARRTQVEACDDGLRAIANLERHAERKRSGA